MARGHFLQNIYLNLRNCNSTFNLKQDSLWFSKRAWDAHHIKKRFKTYSNSRWHWRWPCHAIDEPRSHLIEVKMWVQTNVMSHRMFKKNVYAEAKLLFENWWRLTALTAISDSFGTFSKRLNDDAGIYRRGCQVSDVCQLLVNLAK